MASFWRIVRPFPAIVALAACLHAVGIAQTRLPAQDGLKILQVARGFQTQPWGDVIRGTDRHPLYPALIALVEPIVSSVTGRGPDGWRVAAQLVSSLAAVALLFPLYSLARLLFDESIARMTVLGYVLLPIPMALGHDTLGDSLALGAFLLSLKFGLDALSGGWITSAVGSGVAAGIGFLVRPEVLLAPLSVLVLGVVLFARSGTLPRLQLAPRLAAVGLSFLVMVGAYALVKGRVSEKLSLRNAASIGPVGARAGVARTSGHWLPPGLDDDRWDFSPKEEPVEPAGRSLATVAADFFQQWAEGLGWVLAGFALWGFGRDLQRQRAAWRGVGGFDPAGVGRWLIACHVIPFSLLLIRHEWRMGYLSNRHVLTLVVLSLPWAALGVRLVLGRIGGWVFRDEFSRKVLAGVVLTVVIATSVRLQCREPHPSRWGHLAAGIWLKDHVRVGEAVLDTRGWAAFVSGARAYDYWHVRQSLTDHRLSYVVVGEDEYQAPSRRGATLRALLAHAAEPAARFPARQGGEGTGVRVYRFHRPESWEGIRP